MPRRLHCLDKPLSF